ncbi:hypothetical protein C2845_PM07G04010 [Panicum miliaceum]|uniref:NmrA-like domain-containing protein n=1 Tax=Panicum miliaceum TaxID=4540 RepID=A0A3L6SMJ4_PANMI|nr:hypothetical protein C2845_PM07G04010 [Panicum miliaceum]
MASEKSKILVVGGTGYLGRHVVAASARLGHPTFALVRDTAPPDAARAALLKSFKDAGVTLVKGDLGDQASLRFIPSEFGLDADRSDAVEPARSTFITTKAAIRRAAEGAGVPYTFVWTGYFFGYGLPGIGQVLARSPPADKAVVLGGGDTRASFADEGDIGTYTVLAADDPRAANRTLYVKPPANTLSHNELLALWEGKTGRAFERVRLDEDAVLRQIQEAPTPLDSILLSIGHAVHIKGEHEFEVDPSSVMDATEHYPYLVMRQVQHVGGILTI